jgi:CRP-like cAMP-binding protein
MGLFTEGSLRTADCIAASPTTCAVLSRATLDEFCDTHPPTGLKVYRAIIKTLAERLQTTSADLAMLMGTHVRSQRDVADIVEKAKQARTRKKDGGAGTQNTR